MIEIKLRDENSLLAVFLMLVLQIDPCNQQMIYLYVIQRNIYILCFHDLVCFSVVLDIHLYKLYLLFKQVPALGSVNIHLENIYLNFLSILNIHEWSLGCWRKTAKYKLGNHIACHGYDEYRRKTSIVLKCI